MITPDVKLLNIDQAAKKATPTTVRKAEANINIPPMFIPHTMARITIKIKKRTQVKNLLI